jgi:hypothetical protein
LADQFEAGLIQMGDAVGTCGICGQGIIAKEVKGEGDNFGRPVQVFAFARHAPARYVVCAEKGHTNFYWLDKSSGKAVEPLGNKVNLNSGIPYSLRTVNGMIEQWKEIEIFFSRHVGYYSQVVCSEVCHRDAIGCTQCYLE